jgi:hypothetical protein
MARGTNPNRWKQRRDVSDEPSHLAQRGMPHRGTVITPPIGQQIFQATLLEIFAHPTREHPWNPTGRTLTKLFECYGSWISPQSDRMIIGSTLAKRMVGYLLPYVNQHRAYSKCRGIPGLRLIQPIRQGYELLHLPTQTMIEIRDGSQGRIRSVRQETRINRDDNGYKPIWQKKALTNVERQWDEVWQPTAHTSLSSAWFNALRLFDSCVRHKEAHNPVFQPAAADTARGYLRWCGTATPADAVAHLTRMGVGACGKPLTVTSTAPGFAIVTAGGVSLELHQRTECADCGDPHIKWHGRPTARERTRRTPALVGSAT